MRQILLRLLFLSVASNSTALNVWSQEIPANPSSVDPDLLNLPLSHTPSEYTIAGIKVTGAFHLDTTIVLSISGLVSGEKVTIPGTDIFSKAIQNLWRQRLFSDVRINYSRLQGDQLWIEINVKERPRLSGFKFVGPSKNEADELRAKLQLMKQAVITENTFLQIREVVTKYYRDKGFYNVRVTTQSRKEVSIANTRSLVIYVDKGAKVRVDEIRVFGNESVEEQKIKKQMSGTKERTRFTLFPSEVQSPFGSQLHPSLKPYLKDWGFLSFSKTRQLLDPYLRVKLFSSAKFNEAKYQEDKQRIIKYYNALGYRDASIVEDVIMVDTPKGSNRIYADIKVNEGRKYYFGNIVWKGNTKYPDSLLNALLGISKGDVYNEDILNKRLGKELALDGRDISAYYMDGGYLFFRAEAVETAVYNDTIDHEIRITEGAQARINKVSVTGNEKTYDHVIIRELTTVPGELFRRTEVIRSTRELGALQYFNPETINPGIIPDASAGTVDINWKVEERSSDQFELSAGWGANMGVTGTFGVTFNNISLRRLFHKDSWDPFPQGDGQKLSVRYQSTGRIFNSYNFSFTEPWLGDKKRNSLTVSFYKSKFSNSFDPVTGLPDDKYSKNNYLKTLGISLSLGKQLKWPDDYFSLVYTLNYTKYTLKDYTLFQGLSNGVSNNVSFKIALNRNSSGPNPYYPTSGSNFSTSVQFTPPYSLINSGVATSSNPYKNPEYHKWRFSAEWYGRITPETPGTDKKHVPVLKLAVKYGFMGRYNKNLDYSPFERFQLGDAGMSNSYGLLGYDIIAQRGYPVYESSDPSVNSDQKNSNKFFTLFNKYQLELRYPLVMNTGSTIYGLAFFEAANGWYTFKDYNPFRLRRSVGVGMRFYLPMFGLLGFDYGIGLDRMMPGGGRLKNASKFTIMLGIEPE